MKFSGFVLLLLLHRSYSALDVVAPTTHNALIGSTTLVPCSFKVGSPSINPQFLAILWQYGETELVRYDNKEKYATPRMSIDEGEAKQGNASLTIHNVTIADQGTYKCLVIYSPDKGVKEITVNIHAAPRVKLLKKALSKNGKNHLLCLITNIFPKDITVTWLRNGQALDGSELGIYEMDADGIYRVNSSLTISPKQSQGYPIITCQVEHVSLPDPIQDAFTVQYGVEPKITFFSSHDGGKEIFVCEVKEFYPEAVAIKWLINGKKMEPSRNNADGTYNKWSHFLISGNQKRPNNISCVVEHETLDSPLMKSLIVEDKKDSQTPALIGAISVLTILLTAGILAALWIYKKKYFQWFQVSPIHVLDEWNRNTDTKVTMYCTASNCPDKIQATWRVVEYTGEKVNVSELQTQSDGECDQLLSDDYIVTTQQSETDGLYNAITSLTFTPTIEKHSNMTITCSFLSSGRTKKQDKKWSLTTYLSSKPVMGEITIPFLVHNREAKLECVILGYFPDNLEVKWLRREAEKTELYEVSSNDKYKIPEMEIKHEFDKIYTYTSGLVVSLSAVTDQGVEFICRVKHPSLKTQLEKRTGRLTVKGKPVIKRILQREKHIILEVGGFYTQYPEVIWGESDKYHDQYKRIEEKHIQTIRRENSDGSCSLLSICEVMILVERINLNDKYIKATIQHEALESATNLFFLRSKGHYYIISESGGKMLKQVDEDTLESFTSKYHKELRETEDPVKSSKSDLRANSNKVEAEERKTQES